MSAAIITRERVRGGAPLCGDDLRESGDGESPRTERFGTGMEQEAKGGQTALGL